uniref:HNH endonuclease n=1 Tax=Steinernema glaseri TaxID=37863 RepID=A0A1I7Z062_9BILA
MQPGRCLLTNTTDPLNLDHLLPRANFPLPKTDDPLFPPRPQQSSSSLIFALFSLTTSTARVAMTNVF